MQVPTEVKFLGMAVACVAVVATIAFLAGSRRAQKQRIMHAFISRMLGAGGYDYVIVCCSNLSGERYWQARLDATVGEVTGAAGRVLVVHEDWNGGAGNGLGTLYAVVKASALAHTKHRVDLLAELKAGKSVALYHTAGKGTRLAPLPGAENNNKPAVRLPSLITVNGERTAITVLEAVMRQTSIYADRSRGRLSVYWGDQVFVPSDGEGFVNPPTHHADILAALGPMPTASEWAARALHQYGLIATDDQGDAIQLEKVSYEDAAALLPKTVQRVGTSLGSFSVSADLLIAMLKEFKPELDAKKGQMDADPHFWMPVTLSEDDYVKVMQKKGTSPAAAVAHHRRLQTFKMRVLAESPGLRFFGAVPTGQEMYWWDYGRLGLYMDNNVLLTEDSLSAKALRHFLGAVPRVQHSSVGPVQVSSKAIVLGCNIKGGFIGPRAVLVNVHAPYVNVDNCVLVNVSSTRPISGVDGILYNVVDAETQGSLACGNKAVRADVFLPEKGTTLPRLGPAKSQHIQVHSSLDTDGGVAWKTKLDLNSMSFEQIHTTNKDVDVTAAQDEAARQHKQVRDAA